jgi:hypothetical protein
MRTQVYRDIRGLIPKLSEYERALLIEELARTFRRESPEEAAAMDAAIQAMASDPDIQREIQAVGDGLPAREFDGATSSS